MLIFVLSWIHYSLILFLSTLVSENYVLGTFRLNTMWAAVVAGLIWVALSYRLTFKVKGELKQMIYLFIGNFVALWLVARIAPYSGFGVSRFYWLFILAYSGALVKLSFDKIFALKK